MGLFEHFPYTNFHELNADWMLRKLKNLEQRMTAAEARLDAAEARLTSAEGRLDAIEAEIASITAEIASINSQIAALTARMSDAETRLTAAEGNITAAVNRIAALETRANALDLEISGLKTRMTTAESDIDALEAREEIPAHSSGDSGKVLTATASGLSWATVAGGNLPAISAGDAGKVLTVNSTETGAVWDDAASYPVYIDFTDLAHLPTPSDYIQLIKNGRLAYLRMYRAGITDCTLAPLAFWEQTDDAVSGDPIFYTLTFFDVTGQIAAEVGGSAVASQITIEQNVTAGTVSASATAI